MRVRLGQQVGVSEGTLADAVGLVVRTQVCRPSVVLALASNKEVYVQVMPGTHLSLRAARTGSHVVGVPIVPHGGRWRRAR